MNLDVSVACPQCSQPVRIGDDFCQSCGWVVSAEHKRALVTRLEAADLDGNVRRGRVTRASAAMLILSVMYALSGLVIFVAADGFGDAVELDAQRTLLINLGVSAIMMGLFFWSRREPLPAMLWALAIFVMVNVVSAIASPITLGQGLILKLVAIGCFVTGIKSAIEARDRDVRRGSPP